MTGAVTGLLWRALQINDCKSIKHYVAGPPVGQRYASLCYPLSNRAVPLSRPRLAVQQRSSQCIFFYYLPSPGRPNASSFAIEVDSDMQRDSRSPGRHELLARNEANQNSRRVRE